ncbi:MAG: TOPRIM nucleotidyl transferase/hydrolase domain-containing protein, partial [Gaiellaceae bacterium]
LQTDEGMVVMQRDAPALAEHCRALGAPLANADTVLPFYDVASNAEILSGFFARRIVLVEGATEREALPAYLKQVGLDVVKEGIAIVSVQGVGNLARWFRLFSAYGIPVYVIFDNDNEVDPEARRRDDLFAALRLDEETKTGLLQAETLVVDPGIAVFGRNFEDTLRGWFLDDYDEQERAGREVYGLTGEASKPLLGRYIAEQLVLEEGTGPWNGFTTFAEAINASA